MNTRQTILIVVAVLLVGALAVWWYFGFTLDFMRFFAAEQGTTDTDRLCNAPPGCTCQVVQCIQAPCDPIIVCPTGITPPPGCYYQEVQCIQAPCDPQLVCPSCQPRPACLDATPRCMIAEPADGWCPSGGGTIVSCGPGTQTVGVGVTANLSAAGGNGSYEWFSPEGNRISGVQVGTGGVVANTYSVTYTTPGTKKVTVQSRRGDGSANVDSVACTVIVTSGQQSQ